MSNTINPLQLAFARWQAEEELARQAEVVQARNYYAGEHDVKLPDRLKEFFNGKNADGNPDLRLNVYHTVVDAVVERLVVTGFKSSADAVQQWAETVWKLNRMDLQQTEVHEMAVRDGEAFVLVDWNKEAMRTGFTPHPRYTDQTIEGDGFGMKMFYPDDDPTKPALYASKRWVRTDGQGRATMMLTEYYPERIVKYAHNGGEFVQIAEEQWVVPEGKRNAGRPLGIPAVHFKNKGMRPEGKDAKPLQDATNKVFIDALSTSDETAFQLLTAFGWFPTADGQPLKADRSNALRIQARTILGTADRDPSKASLEAIEPGDIKQVLEMLQQTMLFLAIVTDTPLSRFQFTKLIAAEGTQQQQEGPHVLKVESKQTRFGNDWEDMFDIGRRVQNAFGATEIDDETEIEVLWKPAQARSAADQQAEWLTKKALGIPLETLWGEMGYTSEQIAKMQQTDEFKARTALSQLAIGAREGGGGGFNRNGANDRRTSDRNNT